MGILCSHPALDVRSNEDGSIALGFAGVGAWQQITYMAASSYTCILNALTY